MPRICGPKLSNCCFVLSIWGIIMLILMGIFFQIDSVALIEDIPSADTVEEGYKLASRNCFIAAGIYGAVLIFCCYQKWAMTKGYTRL